MGGQKKSVSLFLHIMPVDLGSVLKKIEPLGSIPLSSMTGRQMRRRGGFRHGPQLLKHPLILERGRLRTGSNGSSTRTIKWSSPWMPMVNMILPTSIPTRGFSKHRARYPDRFPAAKFGQMTFLRRFWNRLGVKAVARLCIRILRIVSPVFDSFEEKY